MPCYNEAARLPTQEIRRWLIAHPDFGFLLINDGSTDRTGPMIRALANDLPDRCAAIDLPRNQGKAEAVRHGLRALLVRSPETIGYFDADLATPLDELPRLLAALRAAPDCDLLLGSRVRLLGHDIRRRAARHYLGRCFATAASVCLGLAVYDTQCGAKLMRVGPWIGPLLADPFHSRWVFDVELIARYLQQVRRCPRWPEGPCGIVELPLLCWTHRRGSKVGPMDFLRAVLELWRITRLYPRPRR